MTYDELKQYFDCVTPPETLQIDRATTQYEVANAVNRNLAWLQANPSSQGSVHRLLQIKNAIENPYVGRVGLLG